MDDEEYEQYEYDLQHADPKQERAAIADYNAQVRRYNEHVRAGSDPGEKPIFLGGPSEGISLVLVGVAAAILYWLSGMFSKPVLMVIAVLLATSAAAFVSYLAKTKETMYEKSQYTPSEVRAFGVATFVFTFVVVAALFYDFNGIGKYVVWAAVLLVTLLILVGTVRYRLAWARRNPKDARFVAIVIVIVLCVLAALISSIRFEPGTPGGAPLPPRPTVP